MTTIDVVALLTPLTAACYYHLVEELKYNEVLDTVR